ncbi:Hypothetical predicted protein [Cloeon dipterum]|uniref:Uncharacterized protein n=1 Tax=Cloeon dipterum TaxID=197152 RepID=A0A8S1DUP5_9INSE|nr:Hypothetical predicted protein [Cloeon dipterum]
MSKKVITKPPARQSFSEFVDRRDLVKIHSTFTSEAVALELISSLSNARKKLLWECICESLFSLSPNHSDVVSPVAPRPPPLLVFNGVVSVRDSEETEPDGGEPSNRKSRRTKKAAEDYVVSLLPEDLKERASIVLVCMRYFLVHAKDREPGVLRTVIDVLNHLLALNICGDKAITICETIWKKKWSGYELLGVQCFQYMLHIVADANCKKADVKRLLMYKEAVEPSASWIPNVADAMVLCLTNKTVLLESNSASLLSRFFNISAKYTEEFHSHVKKALINQSKAEAKAYGQIYGWALNRSSPEMLEVLKTKCIQDFIQKYINVQWDLKAQKMMPHGILLEAVLEEIYYITSSNVVGFKVLLDAYEPLLWRNLSASNPLQRATSIKLLYMMYPIEPHNITRVDQEVLTNKQNELILMSLEDPNHVVRLISVKKIRNILAETWSVMPRPFKVGVCNAIFNKLAFDKSSPDIRREALITICNFINDDNYQMCLFLSKFFKFLKPSIYDECKQVRRAMLQVLLALQEFRHPKAFSSQDANESNSKVSSCWDIVSLRELIEVMATEESNSTILKMCVELAFRSIHPKEPERESTQLHRVIWLIKQGQQIARNFYENSLHLLPVEEAIVFMTKVISRLGVYYRDFDRKGRPRKKEGAVEKPVSKARKRKADVLDEASEGTEENLESFNEYHEETEGGQSQDNMLEPVKESLKNPAIVAGLLDIIMVLWVKHAKVLNENANAQVQAKFESTVQISLEFIFREWKDNLQVLGPILYIGSMLPSKGMKRLLNFCINRIKLLITNNGGIPDQEIKLLATGVCNWDSADILLNMTGDWLAECIKLSISKSKSKAKKPKLQVDPEIENKASAGLIILEKVFTHPLAHAVTIQKSSGAMQSLLKVTEGVKRVIELRLSGTEPSTEMSDELIHSCFKRYVALMNLIPPNKETNFNPSSEFSSLIGWSDKHLLPNTSEDKLSQNGRHSAPLVVQLLSVELRCIAIATHKNIISKDLMSKATGFCQRILATPAATYLVSSLICAAGSLFVNAVLVKQGKRQGTLPKDLLEITLPNLICDILDSGVNASKLEMLIERDSVAKNELKSNIEELYNAYYAMFQRNSVQVNTLDRAFVKAVFKTALASDSGDSGLPYFAEFLINEFQHSSLITPDKFWTLVQEQVQSGLALTPQGRSAVEVFLVVVGSKWPSLLPRKYVDECHKLLSSLANDKAEETEQIDEYDLNQSFIVLNDI